MNQSIKIKTFHIISPPGTFNSDWTIVLFIKVFLPRNLSSSRFLESLHKISGIICHYIHICGCSDRLAYFQWFWPEPHIYDCHSVWNRLRLLTSWSSLHQNSGLSWQNSFFFLAIDQQSYMTHITQFSKESFQGPCNLLEPLEIPRHRSKLKVLQKFNEILVSNQGEMGSRINDQFRDLLVTLPG